MKTKLQNKQGFTLLEILLVVAAIAILAAIVVVAINPAKQLADTRQAERRSEVRAILEAVWQHGIDNDGTLHSNITTTTSTICQEGVNSCSNGSFDTATTSLDFLTPNYLSEIPEDPNPDDGTKCGTGTTCYSIVKNSNDQVTIIAPRAGEDGPTESQTTIEFTR